MRDVLLIPRKLLAADVVQEHIVNSPEFLGVVMRKMSFPDNLILKIVLTENLIEHHLDVMAGVPVAVIVKAAGLFENARQLDAAGPHELDVGLRGFVPVVKGPLLFRLAPEDLVIPIGIEGRIDVDEVDAGIGQLLELLKIVAAIDDARIEKR
jgi:hypothetical protein